MARPKSKKPANPLRWTAIFHWEMDLPAWRFLTPLARCLVIELRRRFNGSNNGEIGLSVRDAATAMNVGTEAADYAMREIQELGWAVITQAGSFHRKTDGASKEPAGRATLWRLTSEPVGLGVDTPATKEYARWVPPENYKPVRRSRTRRADIPDESEKPRAGKPDEPPRYGTGKPDETAKGSSGKTANLYSLAREGGGEMAPDLSAALDQWNAVPDLYPARATRLGDTGRSEVLAAIQTIGLDRWPSFCTWVAQEAQKPGKGTQYARTHLLTVLRNGAAAAFITATSLAAA